ncbi:hypothetical protein B0T10DRAFT_132478 [Thelonectria olida]|uniref:Mid2 domain-containing protein n=1 Tax=Thelonectria olida TaxID=1576542 RepID=A0A9P8VYE3_9HYPO|nr:hypothetical protein B0T10DRAFT_132478 [Thelonectria olida]
MEILFLALGLLLTCSFPSAHGDKVITCYGYSGIAYANNTRCPGSNACCGVDATCLSNRLCHKPNDGADTFLRGPCAVDPYDSGTCAQICLYNETTGVLPRVRPCSDGSLCCDDNDHCCDDGKGIFLDNDGQIADSAPSTTYSYGPERTAASFRTNRASTSTSASTASDASATTTAEPALADATTSATAAETSSASDDDGDSSNGLAIGLGVGLPVAALIVGGLFFIFWWKRRSARKADANTAKELQAEAAVPKTDYYAPVRNYELPTNRPPVELDSGYTK